MGRLPLCTIGPVSIGVVILVSALASATSASAIHPSTPRSCGIGTLPDWSAYDPVTNRMYIPNYAAAIVNAHGSGNGSVTVLRAPCTVVGTINLTAGARPGFAAFDPQNGRVYVTDSVLDQIYVLKGLSVVATLSGPWYSVPLQVAYDPSNGDILVAEYTANNVTVINGTTVVGSFATGSGPSFIALDPSTNTILVTNQRVSTVTVVSNATHPIGAHETNVSVGNNPQSVAYDPLNHLDYVADQNAARLTVMNGTGTVVSTINLTACASTCLHPGPAGLAFSPTSGRMYVTMERGHGVWELVNTSVVKKVNLLNATAVSPVFDSSTGRMYIIAQGTDQAYVLS